MPAPAAFPSPPRRFLPWLLLYALLIVYASTVVGPSGLHFVPLDPAEAWRGFVSRASTWLNTGSDQRADWMGNLGMYVPFGFLLTGTFWPNRSRPSALGAVAAASGALLVALGFLLAVKFAQVWFPPRTVTLNYVAAQTCGSIAGIVAFAVSHSRLMPMAWRGEGGARDNLRLVLWLYSAALLVFMLMPLDFAMTQPDLIERLDRLRDTLAAWPGAGRPRVVRAAMLLAGTLAMAPFGMLLVLGPRGRNRFLTGATARGFAWMLVVLVLSALLISGAPSLPSLMSRTLGIAMGAGFTRWLVRQDPDWLLDWITRLAHWGALPYLAVLLAVNGLLSAHWRGPAEAFDGLYPLGLLPLFDYYIVTKAEAAKNIVAHAAMYAPVGLFVWLRGYRPTAALLSAMLLALGIEAGRYLRPGLEGDINAVAVGALAALFTATLLPRIWWMVEGVTRPRASRLPASMPGWRERAAAARDRAAGLDAGNGAGIEHF